MKQTSVNQPRTNENALRKAAGEQVVSLVVRQALLAGATLKQLEKETGCNRQELQRLVAQLDRIERLAGDLLRD
ncbi:MAG: hypothetical protein R3C53_12925 [Pirellulaceae bacterium]